MPDEDMHIIARIDERTRLILEMLEKKASEESVEALTKRLDKHESSHVSKSSLLAAWAGTIAAIVLGFIGFMRGGTN
ncbi:MAG TPA: hypothetical protein VLH56_18840 [Dissulfurispiraceae bacterium]|nr:hypothetical protein [Dissulfurispiraceae bacterium]